MMRENITSNAPKMRSGDMMSAIAQQLADENAALREQLASLEETRLNEYNYANAEAEIAASRLRELMREAKAAEQREQQADAFARFIVGEMPREAYMTLIAQARAWLADRAEQRAAAQEASHE